MGRRRPLTDVEPPAPRLPVAQQVGDQVDRAGREHDAVRARELAGARSAPCGRGSISTVARAELAGQRRERRRRQRARACAAVQTRASHVGEQSARASPRRPCRRGSRRRRRARRPATNAGSDSVERLDPAGVVGAVEARTAARRRAPRSVPARSRRAAARAAPPSRSRSRPRKRARGGTRRRSCAAGRRRARRSSAREPALDASHERRATLAAVASATARALRVEPRADDERRPGPHDVELLARDVGNRRPEVARVLEPDVGQHRDARVDDVGRVVAAAEPGLEHRDVDPGRSRTPHSAAAVSSSNWVTTSAASCCGAVDELGGAHGARDRRREALRRDVALARSRIRSR